MILVRDTVSDTGRGAEILMLKRDSRLSFAGGLWVFPGQAARRPPADFDPAAPDDLDRAERNAAVREAAEEAGLDIDADALVALLALDPAAAGATSGSPPRSSSPPAPSGAVVIDDGEIRDHQWMSPAGGARRARRRRDRTRSPDVHHAHVPCTLTTAPTAHPGGRGGRAVEHFSTQVAEVDGHVVALYHGDVGYGDGDPDAPGGRHRLWLDPNGWTYERR